MDIRRLSLMQMMGIVVVAASMIGCQAFNDHPIEFEQDLANQGLSAKPEAGVSDEAPVNTSLCAVASAVKVVAAEENSAPVLATMLGEDAATVTATASSADAVVITVATEKAEVKFLLKRDGKDSYAACSVSYIVDGEAKEVTGGSVTVALFNAKDDASGDMLNSGSFELTVAGTDSATKAAGVMLGAKVETGSSITGTYAATKTEAAE